MSKVNSIQRLDPRVSYVGAAWSNTGTAAQDPAAGGVTPATNAIAGRGQFGTGPQELTGYSIVKGTGGGVTAMVPGVDFTYDRRLDSTDEGGVNVYDTASVGNLASGKYFRIVEGGSNIRNTLYPKSPDIPSYGLQIIAKDLSTEFSPPATQCYVDPVKGKFVLPRPSFWTKCDVISPNNGATIDTYGAYKSVWGGVEESIDTNTGNVKWNNGWFVNAWWNSGVNFYILGNFIGWTQLTLSQWLTSWGIGYHGMGSDNCYVMIYPGGGYVDLFVNGSSVGQWAFTYTSKMHCYMVIDITGGMSGGVAVKLYINGTQVINPSGGGWVGIITIPGKALFRYQSGSSSAHGYATSDNHKAWTELVGDPTNYSLWDYNSGSGRESGLHYIYGSASGYTPTITGSSGVCYDYIPLPTDPVKLIKGTDITATLENATNIAGGSAIFGTPTPMATSSFAQINEGVHFAYGKRLDASTLEDPTNGYGSTAGGIVDTGASGALASGKYIRIVDKGVNVKNAGGLNLKVYAYDLEKNYNPPSDRCYVDPYKGKLILPGPTYWSKLESFNNAYLPEYCTYLPVTEKTGYFYYAGDGYATEYMKVKPGKFGNCISVGQWVSPANQAGNYYIYPAGKVARDWSRGVISGWYSQDTWDYSTTSDRWVYHYMQTHWLPSIAYCYSFRHDNDYCWVTLYLDWPGQPQQAYGLSLGVMYHIYVVWDVDKSLPGGKSIIIYVNGVEALSSTASVPSGYFSNYIMYQMMYAEIYVTGHGGGSINASMKLDNLKVWDTLVQTTPAWEYNVGTGREEAMLPVYGEANQYAPRLTNAILPYGGVGYYRAGSAGNYATLKF